MAATVADDLHLFVRRVQELQDTRLLRRIPRSNLTFKWERDGPLRIIHEHPSDDDLRAALTILRQFVLKGARVNLNKVYNFLERYLNDTTLRDHLRAGRNRWKKALREGPMAFMVHEQRLTPEHIYDLFINGRYFHDDVEKERELAALAGSGLIVSSFLFEGLVWDLIGQVFFIGNIILRALDEGLLRSAQPRRLGREA